jgi:hypothetical protein
MKFTERQINNWKQYERVRQTGVFNMFDKRAMECTTLEKDEWFFCISNYAQLKSQADEEQTHAD